MWRSADYMNEKEKIIHEKSEEISKIIPKLNQQIKDKPSAILYQGIESIKNFYKNILDDLNSGEEYYVIGVSYGIDKPGVKEFFENYHRQRYKKKIKVKMLVNFDVKGELVPALKKLSDIRYLPKYFISDMIILFYKNKSFIFFLNESPTGLLMINESAVKSFKTYFDTLWKIAKK